MECHLSTKKKINSNEIKIKKKTNTVGVKSSEI